MQKSLKKLVLAVIFITFVLLIPNTSIGVGQSYFSRNLKLGNSGSDVLMLQKILNSNIKTILASSGPGSPGNETDYFGPITLQAVKKFQELYKNEVLLPIGLNYATGYVGSMTRAKLESLSSGSQSSVSQVETKKTDIESPSIENTNTKLTSLAGLVEPPVIYYLSKYYTTPNSSVTLYGKWFTEDNDIHIGSDFVLENVKSLDGTTLTFTIPISLSGDFNLWVENERGDTHNPNTEAFFHIGSVEHNPPTVFSVSPSRVKRSVPVTITIKGSGFHSTNNTLITSLGTLKNVSSTNSSISFNISSLPDFYTLSSVGKDKGLSVPVFISIQNEYGSTFTPNYFFLEL